MFGGNKPKRSFRQSYRGFNKDGKNRDNISPTDGSSKLSQNTGFSSASTKSKPMNRFRSAFRSNKASKQLSPRYNSRLPLEDVSSERSPREYERAAPLSPVGEQKLRMMPKIAAYRTKGYLTASQERDLFSQLERKHENPFDASAVSKVDQQLEEFKSMSFAGSFDSETSADSKMKVGALQMTTLNKGSKPPPRAVGVPNDQKQFLRALLQKENARTASRNPTAEEIKADVRSKTSLFETSLIDQVEPEEEDFDEQPDRPYKDIPLNDRVILSSADVFDKLDENFVENLFVETCFFARLGFLQPPTCLRCLYLEAMEGMDEDIDCQNWVVWRKDATAVLHPHAMDGNLHVVQCHAARRLVEGELVQDHNWDAIKRQLVRKEG